MLTSFMVILRIFSNSLSNVYQKQLTSKGFNPSYINFIMYAGITILLLPYALTVSFKSLGAAVYMYSAIGGIFGALGNYFLVKALENGELSVLGPINAYKSVVAMIIGIFLLNEIPSLYGLFAIILIILGSYFVFDTQEEGFSLNLLKRADIRYRIYALIFTGVEAVFIKDVILNSNVMTSLFLWSFFGLVFTGILTVNNKNNVQVKEKFIYLKFLFIILLIALMQYSTNYVFSHMQVSYGLALFQLSALLSVIFGWKYFDEKHIIKKLTGSFIMVLGAAILVLS